MGFIQPKRLHNSKGEVRKVGIEIEFGNVPIEKTANIIIELYGGQLKRENRFMQKVENTSLGDFSIEMDARLLTEKAYLKPLQKLNIDISKIQMGDSSLESGLEDMLEGVVSLVVPYEIGTPPVPITELHQLERLRESLFRHEAKGTRAFPTNIFGTHLNPEIPDEEAGTILNYLRAFLLVYPWMLRSAEIDLARRLSPYIDPFPDAYAELILQPDYKPDIDKLIDDYHKHNPDRNRPLDMYPLFAYLKKDKVAQYDDMGIVKERPTFHYRLPNSQIEEADWSLEKVWNNWVVIENLAEDKEKLEELASQYLSMRKDTFIGFNGRWAKQTDKWLSLE
ncbi:hypothetical protein D770_19150 [Flammeovirgaceae bacterium 311]|nr:hypothetical protein D770_19150 [Flammeovirgaceae bacterium 311]